MNNQTTNSTGLNTAASQKDLSLLQYGIIGSKLKSDLDRLRDTETALPALAEEKEKQLQDVHTRILELLNRQPPAQTVNDRLIDEGVREWIDSDNALKRLTPKTKWPETEAELFDPSVNSPDNRVELLAGTGNQGYNGYNATVFRNTSSTGTAQPVAGHVTDNNFRLEIGTISDDVKTLQQRLNALGYTDENGNPLAVNGEFNNHTLAAVNKFKDAVLPGGNLGENRGVVGPTTWNELY